MSSAPPHVSTDRVYPDWVCPFCALLCDDVTIHANADGTLAAPDTRCPRLAQALLSYGGADAQCGASIDGAPVGTESALEQAAQWLAHSHRPLFGGLATDVAGTRALYALAAACGATLDHLHGDTLMPGVLAQQDRGALFTTLSEIRTRADLVVVFACRPAERHPRFYERALGGGGFARHIVFVGCAADPAANAYAADVAGVTIETLLPNADPYDTLARWSARVESRSGAATRAGGDGSDSATLGALVERIAAARYTAFIYESAALPGEHTALLIEALHRIVKAVNRTVRGGALALGGGEGGATVNQTLTWLSGLPLRTRVAKPLRLAGEPPLDHDPYRYRTSQLLARGEADLLLWIASFGADPLPSALDPTVPAIVLGHPALAGAVAARRAASPLGGPGAPTVFVPVATPGIDSSGHLFRVDGPVVLPLAAARNYPLPPVHAVIEQLSLRVAELAHAHRDAQTPNVAAVPVTLTAPPPPGASA